MQTFRQVRLALLDLIFPPRCAGCGRGGEWFCSNCVASLHKVEPPICERCGQELPDSPTCVECRHHPLPAYLNGLRVVAHHDGPLRKAIHAMKYEQLTATAEPLALLLCAYLEAHPLPFDVLMPVPLHEERRQERGYNQAALLADVIGRRSR